MAVTPVIEVLTAALEAFAAVPRIYDATKDILPRFRAMIARGEGSIVIEGLLGIVVDSEVKRLKRLIDDYYSKDQDSKYGALEKDEYRQRIAAQVCSLLKELEPIKDKLPDYDRIRKLYCERFPTG